MTTIVEYQPMPPFMAQVFIANGFSLPVVTAVTTPTREDYIARVEKSNGSYAELLSPRSPEDAISRLAREIVRNRTERSH